MEPKASLVWRRVEDDAGGQQAAGSSVTPPLGTRLHTAKGDNPHTSNARKQLLETRPRPRNPCPQHVDCDREVSPLTHSPSQPPVLLNPLIAHPVDAACIIQRVHPRLTRHPLHPACSARLPVKLDRRNTCSTLHTSPSSSEAAAYPGCGRLPTLGVVAATRPSPVWPVETEGCKRRGDDSATDSASRRPAAMATKTSCMTR